MFNEQTYANKSRHFRLKHFCISRDANEIVLRELVVILKFLNLTAMLIAGLTHLLVVS